MKTTLLSTFTIGIIVFTVIAFVEESICKAGTTFVDGIYVVDNPIGIHEGKNE